MTFNAHHDFGDNLRAAMAAGKRIELYLRNGDHVGGVVRDVGPHFVVIGEMTGKEYFDALVRLDDVCAMDVRVRS